jgi:hypothetical protein
MAAIVIKIQNIQLNAATTKQKQHRNKMTETRDTFSNYCEDNIKKFYIKYTCIIKGPYNKQ